MVEVGVEVVVVEKLEGGAEVQVKKNHQHHNHQRQLDTNQEIIIIVNLICVLQWCYRVSNEAYRGG